MQEGFTYNPEIMKSQLSLLPPIEQLTLQQLAKKRKINFNVMLSLPVYKFLLKDKALEDRKDTIAIYRKRKFEPLLPQKHKVPLINSGRIHCPEFWSDKYQNTALRDSHIDKNLNKYRQIIKTNIQEYLNKCDLFQKEQIQEVRDAKFEPPKRQCSISEDEFAPSNNELNLSKCTQEDIFNYYLDPNNNHNISIQKTSLTNLDKIACNSVKQSFIEKFDKVISSCNRTSDRSSIDTINIGALGNKHLKIRKRILGSNTSRSHY